MDPPLVFRACPLCDGTKTELRITKGALRVVECRDCAMLFANPVAGDLATGSFYDRLGTCFYLSPDKLESDYAPVRFERELRCFRRFCPRGAVLDVGCSSGAFLFQLKARHPADYTVVGTDVTSAALDYAESRGIQVLRTSFLDLDFGGPCFEAITFWAVMEHLVYPKDFLAKACSILKPRGLCFMLVPNMKSLAVRLLGPKYRYIMPDHVNYFTPTTLRSFAHACGGFEVIGLQSTHFNPLVILKDFAVPADRIPDEQRAGLLQRTTAWKQNPALRPLRWIYGTTEWMLGSVLLADNLVIVLRKTRPEG